MRHSEQKIPVSTLELTRIADKINNAVNLDKSRLTADFLASQKGFEPPTPTLGGWCSIQLSYWDIC